MTFILLFMKLNINVLCLAKPAGNVIFKMGVVSKSFYLPMSKKFGLSTGKVKISVVKLRKKYIYFYIRLKSIPLMLLLVFLIIYIRLLYAFLVTIESKYLLKKHTYYICMHKI